MGSRNRDVKVGLITLMMATILCLHFLTLPTLTYYHAVYRILFYLPLIMGGVWFGMRGTLYVCVAVLTLFSPYVLMHWEGLSIEEFDTLLEGVLYVATAVMLGLLSEREKRERAARLDAERLAAVGKAVSEVAHEMKTPLMAIGGFTRQVSRSLHASDPNQKKLGIVVEEAARLESMVREMLDFGRPMELERTQADLNELVHHAVEVSRPMAGEAGIELEVHLEFPLPAILLDVRRIKQVLLNLIANAVQASPAGEKVKLRTSMRGHRVILETVDSGFGIKAEDYGNVFRPFFSTKKGGTGLGLAIVKKIVETHGGEIAFCSNPHGGVTFTVTLPLGEGRP